MYVGAMARQSSDIFWDAMYITIPRAGSREYCGLDLFIFVLYILYACSHHMLPHLSFSSLFFLPFLQE